MKRFVCVLVVLLVAVGVSQGLVTRAISLTADTKTISESGGVVSFDMHGGSAYANQEYFLLGSVSGTKPGIPLPGGAILPLNWDALTQAIINLVNTPMFPGFYGTTTGTGYTNARLNTMGGLPPGMVGIKLYFACGMNDGTGKYGVSNSVHVEIVP